MSEVNVFEQASKIGLRYATNRGTLSTDDLWNLKLPALDVIAMSYKKEIDDASDSESFITKKPTVSKVTVLALEICKRIIEVKIEEKDVAEKTVANKQMKDRITQIIAEKQNGALQEKSLEELQEMANKL